MNSRGFSAISSESSEKNTWPKRLDAAGRALYNAPAVLTGDGLQNAEIDGSAAGPVPFAMNEVLSRGKRTVVRVVLLQAGCAAIVASVFLVFKGAHQALAALVGGLIVAAGSAVLGWRVFKPGVAGGATLTTAMYAGVLLKWLWFALALYLAIARLKLDAVPLLIGIVVAQLGYWVGLIRLR
jgi:F0F1-type ATP synthase assembly protein I